MRRNNANVVVGLLVLTVDVLLLAHNFNLFTPWESGVWTALFAAAGVGFLAAFAIGGC
jgi:hypothetical protein